MQPPRTLTTLALWTLYALPLGYVGLIFAVVVHEILGHGCTALVVGGEFFKFDVHLDGYGRAWTRTSTDSARLAVLAGGIISGIALGGVLYAIATRCRVTLRVRLALLVLATASFHDALPYGLWDAIIAGGHGDVSQILRLVPSEPLRITLVITFGLGYILAIWLSSTALFRVLEEALGSLSAPLAWGVTTTMTVLMAAGYLAFDWDQLIPGAGHKPTLLIAALHGVLGIYLCRTRRTIGQPTSPGKLGWPVSLATSWLAAALTLIAVMRWLRHGVVL